MKITKKQLKQLIKEELEDMQARHRVGSPSQVPPQYDPDYIAQMEEDIRSAQDDALQALEILKTMGKVK